MVAVAAGMVGSAVVGSMASRSAAKKAGAASKYAVDASKDATDRQQDLAERQYQDYLDDIRPRKQAEMDRAIETSKKVEGRAAEQFDFERANSQRYSDRYWGTQVPLEDGLIRDAQEFSTSAEQERQAGLATSDIRGQFEQMRGQMDRNNTRRGINPNSGAAMAMAQEAAQMEALAGAGASTTARFNAKQMGFARRADVAALGRGLPGFSSSSTNAAGSANSQALGAGVAGLSAVGMASGISNAAAQTSSGIWGASVNSATAGVNAFNQSLLTAFKDPMQTVYGNIAGIGTSYAGMKLGGP